jgi:ribosome-associated protein
VQGKARDEGRQAGQDEERPFGDEGALPHLRNRSLPDHEFVRPLRLIDSQAKALTAARAALEKQAEGVLVLDLRALSTIADFFVICTADSARQIDAITAHIDSQLSRQGGAVWHTEGAAASSPSALRWVLMDCGDVVVHVQDQRARTFYRLEDLWADAPRIPLEQGAPQGP